MAGPRLNALRKQFTELRTGIDAINAKPEGPNGDLTEAQQADVDKLLDRAEALKPDIDREAEREESIRSTAEVLARVTGETTVDRSKPASAGNTPVELSAAEYFAEYLSTFGPEGSGNIDRFLDRAGQYFDRAEQATTDNAGVLPTPIVGQLIKLVDASRPTFTSLTSRPMPAAGKTFTRPRVTQRVAVAEQLVEFDPLASQKMTLVGDPVTKRTFGGTLDISEQDIDWTDPAMLAIVIDDFADEYAIQTEIAAKVFVADLPATHSPYVSTDVGTLVDSFVDASVALYGQCSKFADTVWLGLPEWAVLASTVTTDDSRPALTVIRDAFATANLPQLRFVVAPGLDASAVGGSDQDIVMGVSALTESYEQQKGLLRLLNPGVLSQTIATYGYVCFYGRPEGVIYLGTEVV